METLVENLFLLFAAGTSFLVLYTLGTFVLSLFLPPSNEN